MTKQMKNKIKALCSIAETVGRMENEHSYVKLAGEMRVALIDEEIHLERSKLYDKMITNQAVFETQASFNSAVATELESIRLYADRETPNKEGILESVAEIKKDMRKANANVERFVSRNK